MGVPPAWKAVQEEAAFNRLQELEQAAQKLGLPDSAHALSVLLRRRLDSGTWNWGLFEDCVNTLELEFSQQDRTYAEGLGILKGILEKTWDVKRRKGRRMEPFGRSWTPDERSQLDASLGVLTEALQRASDAETAVLLAGLGHVIRYETKGGFVRSRIHYWASPSIRLPADREQLVEDFFTLKGKGSDGRSDVTHIRNAIAHAHFEFTKGSVELWDFDPESEKETFRKRFSGMEFLELSNTFERKLVLAEVYPSLLLAIEDLFSVYKKEWRSFRR
jgi:hypothetical protein